MPLCPDCDAQLSWFTGWVWLGVWLDVERFCTLFFFGCTNTVTQHAKKTLYVVACTGMLRWSVLKSASLYVGDDSKKSFSWESQHMDTHTFHTEIHPPPSQRLCMHMNTIIAPLWQAFLTFWGNSCTYSPVNWSRTLVPWITKIDCSSSKVYLPRPHQQHCHLVLIWVISFHKHFQGDFLGRTTLT